MSVPSRHDVLPLLASRVGFTVRHVRQGLPGSDLTRFLGPLNDILEDVGQALRFQMELRTAPSYVQHEVSLIRSLASSSHAACSGSSMAATAAPGRSTASPCTPTASSSHRPTPSPPKVARFLRAGPEVLEFFADDPLPRKPTLRHLDAQPRLPASPDVASAAAMRMTRCARYTRLRRQRFEQVQMLTANSVRPFSARCPGGRRCCAATGSR
mmetsp:Transcript_100023/g.317688  ORF Transcript_100023/g.317688 Transcript_100023/m.317688 type:complete len:212 (-) Transcript_100023:503-1138(-)